MKKILLIALMLTNIAFVKAQNYDTLYIQNVSQQAAFHYCANEYDGVVVMGEPNWNCEWNINFGGHFYANSIVLLNSEYNYYITYQGSTGRQFDVFFHPPLETSPFAEPLVWKRQGDTITLSIPYEYEAEYEWEWFNGSNDYGIDVTDDGIYSATFTSLYGCELEQNTFSVEVHNNVEISLATTDLATNLNMVTWQTTDEQAEYVSQVKIYRDGALVGTAPYADGSFTDNIGSEAASRTYTVLAVAPDGTDCPILSHPKETIHMTYTLGVGNTIVIGWNHPTGYELAGYNICEWNPNAKNDGLTVIDYVGAGVSSYTCSESQFDHGMIVVQGVERTKDAESRLLSNRSLDYVGLGENYGLNVSIYPNPSNPLYIMT